MRASEIIRANGKAKIMQVGKKRGGNRSLPDLDSNHNSPLFIFVFRVALFKLVVVVVVVGEGGNFQGQDATLGAL